MLCQIYMKRKLKFCRQSCRSSLRYHGNDNFWQNLTAFRAENAGFNICLRNFIFGLKYEKKNDLLSYRSFFEYLPNLIFISKKHKKLLKFAVFLADICSKSSKKAFIKNRFCMITEKISLNPCGKNWPNRASGLLPIFRSNFVSAKNSNSFKNAFLYFGVFWLMK